ncbi:TrkH family potassium uptake protein [Reichenbachiella ulvae]|uniref:ATPase n=1 Tax=Reichenbachiella ulvae TaxID=2980104 RepID=A0ABT3CVK5_9BACT|nr:potassium transporter TrkG [Reichenbachiella ulvae]MCV9387604.1 ATPase [Reichenbachiella ulvae]
MKKTTPSIFNDSLVFITSLVALVALVLDFGYRFSFWMHLLTDVFYLLFGLVYSSFFFQQFPGWRKLKQRPFGYYVAFSLSFLLSLIALANTVNFAINDSVSFNIYTAGLVFILTLLELSGRLYNLNRQTLHPALVFALSFVVLICIGTLLLMTPRAAAHEIHFTDALFTATSAVCVTGLAVLDTGKDFTLMGQLTILGLIQLGALGMLSFTSLFALFFKGFGSFESRLNIKDMINAETLEGTFKRLIQIIIFVFVVEGLGAFLIFLTLGDQFDSFNQRLFFSIFHSVSAFCNAGFSTLSHSLYETGFRYNYNLHIIIAILIVAGGLGYGVVINLTKYLQRWFLYGSHRIFRFHWGVKAEKIKPQTSLNSKIVVYTSLILIVVGSIIFYALEFDNTLKKHSIYGKLITAIFGSITTRTAGFNTIDTGSLHMSTLMIVLLLMWIGASPGSTGGGIKTTTFAVATFNIVQQVFGYKQIKIGFRRIAPQALQRATAIISLSLIVIGASTFLLIFFDEQLGIMPIAFECFSAFSTVGLSMGITSELSEASRLILIITMFVGRVSLLTLLTGIVRQIHSYEFQPIEYPEEEILIN